MVARDVDQAAARLRAFQVGAWEHFGLAVIAFGLALGATQLLPEFGMPLLVGGIASLALGVRDEIRRWDLIDRLVLDRDAYGIPVVSDRAEQAATIRSRRALAVSARVLVARTDPPVGDQLELLAAALDDEELDLDPASAVVCDRLLRDVVESPLYDPACPVEDARARITWILARFRAHEA